jgi:hypothetical protein
MKTFLSDIFPRIQRFSKDLDILTLLTNQHWVSIDDTESNKIVYIFRTNKELLISKNGKVDRASWEYLGNKSILIEINSVCYLFKYDFFNENILALKVDNSFEYAVFVNENNFEGELNSISKINDFLKHKYFDLNNQLIVDTSSGSLVIDTNTQTVFRNTIDNKTLKIISTDNNTIGAKVYIGNQSAHDNTYIYLHNEVKYKLIVVNGEIVERYYLEKYKNYIFEKKSNGIPEIGDKIFKSNGELVEDGMHNYSILFKRYKTVNGIIVN